MVDSMILWDGSLYHLRERDNWTACGLRIGEDLIKIRHGEASISCNECASSWHGGLSVPTVLGSAMKYYILLDNGDGTLSLAGTYEAKEETCKQLESLYASSMGRVLLIHGEEMIISRSFNQRKVI